MLLPLFEWCENTRLGDSIRSSLWLFPVVESLHLLALAVIGGAVLLVDLRLLGWALRRQSTASLWKDVRPWFSGSLVVMLTSGLLLFTSESIKCYYSDAFWVKMWALLLATLFTLTVRRRILLANEGSVSITWRRTVAVVSLVLWSAVGWGGRLIGYGS